MPTRVTEITMGSDDDEGDEEVPLGSPRKRSPTARLQIDEEEDENFPPFEDDDDTGDGVGDEDDEDMDEDDFSLEKSLAALGDIEVPRKKSPQSSRKRSRHEEDDNDPLPVPDSVWNNAAIERWVDGQKKGWKCHQCGFIHKGAHNATKVKAHLARVRGPDV